jgi:hypothetical protein
VVKLEVEELLKNNRHLSHYEMAQLLSKKGATMSSEAVRKRRQRLGLITPKKVLSAKEQVSQDLSRIDEKSSNRTQGKRYNAALKQIAELERNLKVFQGTRDVQTYTIPHHKSGSGSEATAVVLASDWHWGETVTAEQTNGLNEFNPEIRQKRAEKFFSNVVRLVKIFEKDISINTMVLALLGDFISNNIHDELMETNSDLPIDEIIGVQSVIASGIQFILDNTKLNLVIPTASGNHGRTTKKTHFSSEAGNSLEYLMYHNLANHFRDNKRVTFMLSRSYLSYVDVAGYLIRFHHGHAIKYGGGVGGIFISAFKAISQWDKGRQAQLDCFGHFHQVKDGGKFLSNGSLVGFNDFAVRIKADFEKPKQVFFLIDHKRKEKTVTCPVFLE